VVGALASKQHGVVSRRQLLHAGLTSSAVEHLVARGWLLPLHRGVYFAGYRAVGPRGREMAAVLWAGAGAAVGERSAASLWQLLPTWRGDVQLIGPRSKRTSGVVVHRTRSLPRSDVTRNHGIPVTTPARTLIDIAKVVDARTLETALAEAQIRGLVRPEALLPRATGALASALGAAEPTRSRLERKFRRFIAQHDLPAPVINGFVEGFEVDAHWPEARLIVEVDGWRYHSTRRAFETDRERDAILQASGWRVVRVTERQLTAATAERISRLTRPHPRAS
jgi:predicted transcriptional regulator of viral defense system